MASRIASQLDENANQLLPGRLPRLPVPKRRRGLNPRGKKTVEWESIRAELKIAFARLGITRCELRYPGCWTDDSLGFAHSKKRRNCSGRDLWTVILSCNGCHDKIEVLPEKEMERIVLRIIAGRRKVLTLPQFL